MNKLSQQQIKLDERHHVEVPLLNQLRGLGWEVLDLQAQQTPSETQRSHLTEVLMQPVLLAQLKLIQPWLQAVRHDHFVQIHHLFNRRVETCEQHVVDDHHAHVTVDAVVVLLAKRQLEAFDDGLVPAAVGERVSGKARPPETS